MAERPATARTAQQTVASHERLSRPPARPSRPVPFARVPAVLLLLYLAVPLLALLWRGTGPATLRALGDPLVVSAIRLTLLTTGLVLLLAVLTGTPLAYWLARSSFRGKQLVETLVELPIALPPVIAGVALLMAFGRRGVFGPALEVFGIALPFTTAAVVLAQLFVAVPFYVRGAALGFRAVPRELEEAAAVDGATGWEAFRRITLPLAFPGLLSGLLLCGTRAAAEFGATLLFAGNLPGRTQTMTLAIMTAMETDVSRALALAVLLMLVSLAILLGVRALLGGRDELAMSG
ncbi:ABC transporter permease [Thermomicrobiaceae bacterium CFH 74404]|uniref:Molybdenum transport system permease n=1 Tax=Thermalbibacter longus TaxID=2951981 RepID=A0AA42BCZ3_9BACT|nr:ABC transporter permease [Thermalbibacter longus]MCM8749268.1 ABC transporter permease [Thermalbibacter longus]